jgi:hypothetical protein
MTAFSATYSDFKLVKTRKVVQIVLEVPVERANAVLDILGGMPDPSKESWVAVAPLHPDAPALQPEALPPPAGGKRDWRDIPPSQQAGMRCAEPVFVAFLKERFPEEWRASKNDAAELVRRICGVSSRSELNTTPSAKALWIELNDSFIAWKALENA